MIPRKADCPTERMFGFLVLSCSCASRSISMASASMATAPISEARSMRLPKKGMEMGHMREYNCARYDGCKQNSICYG